MMKIALSTISILAVSILLWLTFGFNGDNDQPEIIDKTHSAKEQNFSLPDLNGEQQEFSQWKGQVILLNFWATWCPPCRREMPDFIEVYEEYKDKNFIIIGVGTDNHEKVADFVKKLGVTYPILVGERKAMQVSYQYGNHSGALPYSVLIDQYGVVRYRAGGLISKQKLIQQITPLL